MADSRLTDTELSALAQEYGTPLYVFDERVLADRVRYLRSVFSEPLELCFAMKANPFVLPEVAPLVDRIEVCSPGEYRICRALGMPQSKLVISGVYKDEETIASALGGARLPAAVTIESLGQLDLVSKLAKRRGERVRVLLRLSNGSQFGMDRQDLIEAARRALAHEHLEALGIQLFTGTQKTSLSRLGRELDALSSLMLQLERALGWRPKELEIGPGLPVAYFPGDDIDEPAFLTAYARMLASLEFDGRVVLELGRSLVAACGTYLTRVVDTKRVGSQSYAIVDGGINQLVYFGQSMAMRQPPVHLLGSGRDAEASAGANPGVTPGAAQGTAPSAAPSADAPFPQEAAEPEAWTVCGALCTTNDLLAKQLPLKGLALGSVLAFEKTGAYSMTEGISLFLSRDLPRVAIVDANGRSRLVREGIRTDPFNTPRAVHLGS